MHVRFPQLHLPGEQPLLRYLRLPWSLPYRNLPERFPVYLQELLLQEVLLRQRSVQRVLLPGSVQLRLPVLRVLLPVHMLRHGETVFLDDYTVDRLSQELGSPVQIVGADGGELLDAILETEG